MTLDGAYKYSLLLVHGWGCSPAIWRDWPQFFPQARIQQVDLGFFGADAATSWDSGPEPLIALGHSLGLMWLLKNCPSASLAGLVSLCGFARFAASADFPRGVAPLVLRRMSSRFDREPAATLDDFWARLGQKPPFSAAETFCPSRLHEGLAWLATGDERSRLKELSQKISLLSLAAADDQIVSLAMSQDSFSGLKDAQKIISPTGGHALPWSQPRFCAQAISDFIEQSVLPRVSS